MRRYAPVVFASFAAALVLGCEEKPLEPVHHPGDPLMAKGGGATTGFATVTALPALKKSVHGEAYTVNQAGLIGGYSWDQAGYMHPVTWSMLNGTWRITAYPWDAAATSAIVKAVNDAGDKAGTFWPASAPRAVIWHAAGGYTVLGCGELGQAYGMSAEGQVVVGGDATVIPGVAAVWRPGTCREALPPIVAGTWARAQAVNRDGTIVGGTSNDVPVRWTRSGDAWQVEQLDSRQGSVSGSNRQGDLVGSVDVVPCSANSCSRAIIWYAAGGSRELPTLGGAFTWPRGINTAQEVVGMSGLSNGDAVPFIWSDAHGMRQLPGSGWAFGVSDARSDGTRLVAGAGGNRFAAQVWVVKP